MNLVHIYAVMSFKTGVLFGYATIGKYLIFIRFSKARELILTRNKDDIIII